MFGVDGTSFYRDYAKRIAKLGYYVVLIDGHQILSEDLKGGDRAGDSDDAWKRTTANLSQYLAATPAH